MASFARILILCREIATSKNTKARWPLGQLSFFQCGFCFYPIRLPSLKMLHLKDIHFEINRHLMFIIDECPILEDLQLYDLYGLGFSRDIGKTLRKR